MPLPQLWTTDEVAAYLGYTGDQARKIVSNQLRRWGLEPYDREPGRSGQNRWRVTEVKAAQASATRHTGSRDKET